MKRRIGMRGRGLLLALVASLLAACATPPLRGLPPAAVGAAQAQQSARESALRRRPGWALQGRIGLSNGRDGGSGRIEWKQEDACFDVTLSAPVTRQSWRLTGNANGARLEGLEGGVRAGSDAGALLRAATGWEIPVAALADWVRGMRAATQGAATLAFAADGRLSRIEQAGWTIDYGGWQPASGDTPALPVRLTASHGSGARVRLAIDQWQDGTATP